MRFTTTDKKDKYSYYHTADTGGAIASWVAAGALMSLTLTTDVVHDYAALRSGTHFTAAMAQADMMQEIGEPVNDCKTPPVAPKLSLLMRMEEISRLRTNWDGDGAVTPNADAVRNARKLIIQLDEKDADKLLGGDVYASPYGSVVMDFETERGMVSVEIGDRSMGFFTDFKDGVNYAAEGIPVDGYKVPDVLQKYLV